MKLKRERDGKLSSPLRTLTEVLQERMLRQPLAELSQRLRSSCFSLAQLESGFVDKLLLHV